jgi:hypothetical protein
VALGSFFNGLACPALSEQKNFKNIRHFSVELCTGAL